MHVESGSGIGHQFLAQGCVPQKIGNRVL
jgi:hypothetical protein